MLLGRYKCDATGVEMEAEDTFVVTISKRDSVESGSTWGQWDCTFEVIEKVAALFGEKFAAPEKNEKECEDGEHREYDEPQF